jgi:hypothetical protein
VDPFFSSLVFGVGGFYSTFVRPRHASVWVPRARREAGAHLHRGPCEPPPAAHAVPSLPQETTTNKATTKPTNPSKNPGLTSSRGLCPSPSSFGPSMMDEARTSQIIKHKSRTKKLHRDRSRPGPQRQTDSDESDRSCPMELVGITEGQRRRRQNRWKSAERCGVAVGAPPRLASPSFRGGGYGGLR